MKIKQKKNLITAFLLILALLPMALAGFFISNLTGGGKNSTSSLAYTGGGTSSNPYVLYNEADLIWFRDAFNAGTVSQSCYVTLGASFSMTGGFGYPIGWTGTAARPFMGVFNGNNYTINNFAFPGGNNKYEALIGCASNATIINIKLTNVNIANNFIPSTTAVDKIPATGALVGFADGTTTVRNCSVTGGTISALGGHLGGLIGQINGATNMSVTVSNCYSTANVEIIGPGSNINANLIRFYIGGFSGYVRGAKISNCYASGSVTTSKISLASGVPDLKGGGFSGNLEYGSITDCYSTGNVDIQGLNSARILSGGFVGFLSEMAAAGGVSLLRCYHSGNFQVINTWRHDGAIAIGGGITGRGGSSVPGSITNCAFIGSSIFVSGFEAQMTSRISADPNGETSAANGTGNFYLSTQSVTGTTGFAVITGAGKAEVNKVPYTQAQLRTTSPWTNAGYNFSTTWYMPGSTSINNGYPMLKNMPADNIGSVGISSSGHVVSNSTYYFKNSMTFYGSIAGSHTGSFRYTTNGGSSWTAAASGANFSPSVSANSGATLTVQAIDAWGTPVPATYSYALYNDTTPPSVVLNHTSDSGGPVSSEGITHTYTDTPFISAAASDSVFGVSPYEVKIDETDINGVITSEGTWTDPAGNQHLGAGYWKYSVRATDALGNVSGEVFAYFIVLGTPYLNSVDGTNGVDYVEKGGVYYYAEDGEISFNMGHDTEYRYFQWQIEGDSVWTDVDATDMFTVNNTTLDTNVKVLVKAILENGTDSSIMEINVVRYSNYKTPNDAEVISADGASVTDWYYDDVNDVWYYANGITLNVDSGEELLDYVEYQFNGTDENNWIRLDAVKKITVAVPGPAAGSEWLLYIRSVSLAGDGTDKYTSTTSVKMFRDNEDPVAVLTHAPLSGGGMAEADEWGDYYYATSVRIRANGTDSGSGIGLIQYRTGGGAWQVYDDNNPLILNGIGFYSVTIQATDNLGRVSPSVTHYINIVDPDSRPENPVITPRDFSADTWMNKSPIITITGSDQLWFRVETAAGVEILPWQQTTTGDEISLRAGADFIEGRFRVIAKAVNGYGLESTEVSLGILCDLTTPTFSSESITAIGSGDNIVLTAHATHTGPNAAPGAIRYFWSKIPLAAWDATVAPSEREALIAASIKTERGATYQVDMNAIYVCWTVDALGNGAYINTSNLGNYAEYRVSTYDSVKPSKPQGVYQTLMVTNYKNAADNWVFTSYIGVLADFESLISTNVYKPLTPASTVAELANGQYFYEWQQVGMETDYLASGLTRLKITHGLGAVDNLAVETQYRLRIAGVWTVWDADTQPVGVETYPGDEANTFYIYLENKGGVVGTLSGTIEIELKTINELSNSSDVTNMQVKIETVTPPAANMTASPYFKHEDTFMHNDNVYIAFVKVNAGDTDTIDRIEYRIYNNISGVLLQDYTTYSSTPHQLVKVAGETVVYRIEFRQIDKAGNVGPVSTEYVLIDNESDEPIMGDITYENGVETGGVIVGEAVNFTVKATDAGAGLGTGRINNVSGLAEKSGIQYRLSNGSTVTGWQSAEQAQGDDFWSFTVNMVGEWKLEIRAIDMVGNESLYSEYLIRIEGDVFAVVPSIVAEDDMWIIGDQNATKSIKFDFVVPDGRAVGAILIKPISQGNTPTESGEWTWNSSLFTTEYHLQSLSAGSYYVWIREMGDPTTAAVSQRVLFVVDRIDTKNPKVEIKEQDRVNQSIVLGLTKSDAPILKLEIFKGSELVETITNIPLNGLIEWAVDTDTWTFRVTTLSGTTAEIVDYTLATFEDDWNDAMLDIDTAKIALSDDDASFTTLSEIERVERLLTELEASLGVTFDSLAPDAGFTPYLSDILNLKTARAIYDLKEQYAIELTDAYTALSTNGKYTDEALIALEEKRGLAFDEIDKIIQTSTNSSADVETLLTSLKNNNNYTLGEVVQAIRVVLDLAGGTGIEEFLHEADGTTLDITSEEYIPVKDGYVFLYWQDSLGTRVDQIFCETYYAGLDIVLTAVYIEELEDITGLVYTPGKKLTDIESLLPAGWQFNYTVEELATMLLVNEIDDNGVITIQYTGELKFSLKNSQGILYDITVVVDKAPATDAPDYPGNAEAVDVAVPSFPEKISLKRLGEIQLPEGWEWKFSTSMLREGKNQYVAVFNSPEYSDRYQSLEVSIEIDGYREPSALENFFSMIWVYVQDYWLYAVIAIAAVIILIIFIRLRKKRRKKLNELLIKAKEEARVALSATMDNLISVKRDADMAKVAKDSDMKARATEGVANVGQQVVDVKDKIKKVKDIERKLGIKQKKEKKPKEPKAPKPPKEPKKPKEPKPPKEEKVKKKKEEKKNA